MYRLTGHEQIAYCRKEMAFAAWAASGYRDMAAWRRFIEQFELLGRLRAARLTCPSSVDMPVTFR